MDTTLMGRSAARALAVVLLAGGAAIGLAACQTPSAAPAGPAPAVAPQRGPVDQHLVERYAGRPADRIDEDIARAIARGEHPSPACARRTVVEHPAGGWHLVCTQRHED